MQASSVQHVQLLGTLVWIYGNRSPLETRRFPMAYDSHGPDGPTSRRRFLQILALSGGAAILAACGGSTAPAATSVPAPTTAADTAAPTTAAEPAPAATTAPAQVAPSGGPVTIEWFNRYTTATTQEVIPLMIAEFEKQNPDIKVNYENPGNGDGYIESLLARVAGGNPPDIATLYEPPVEFAARDSLVAIDDFMAAATTAQPDAFFAAPLKSCQWQGKTYGLPSSAGAAALYFNTAQFQAKGISTDRATFPKTMDELKALSREFTTTKDGAIETAGFVPFGNSWMNPAWSAMYGGKLYDTNANKYVLDSDANVQWLTDWLGWLDDLYGGDIEALNAAGTWAGTYPETAFNLQRAAIAGEGSWSSTDAEIPFEWEVARLPIGPGGTKSLTAFYPNWWAIPKGTQQPEAAFKFIEFIATSGWETWYRFIMDTPAWKQFPSTVLTTKLVDQVGQARAENVNTFFADYLNDAVEMWTSPVESFAADTLNTAIGEVLSKAKAPKDALAEAQQLCQAKLDETLKG
jgi:multiple sugar transport system substrate-binding protein